MAPPTLEGWRVVTAYEFYGDPTMTGHEIETREAQVEKRNELGLAEADLSLLKLAVCNLISNVIRYVDRGVAPHLEISAVREGGKVPLQFWDNGMAGAKRINKEYLRRSSACTAKRTTRAWAWVFPLRPRWSRLSAGQSGVVSTPGKGSTF